MRSKKICSAIALLLLIIISLTSCRFSAVETDGINMEWDLNTDFTHLSGREADDKAWACDTTQDLSGPMGSKEVSLKAGGYELSSTMLVDNATANNDVVLEILVKDKETQKVIHSEPVKRGMFKNGFEYTQIDTEFILEEAADVIISYDWKKKSYMRIAKANLVSRYADTIKAKEKAEIVNLFKVPDNEKNMKFESDKLYYFDLLSIVDSMQDSVLAYDLINFIVAIQAQANKEQPSLFINFQNETEFSTAADKYWLNHLCDNGFLDRSKIVKITSPMTVFQLYKNKMKGLVVWDENVPATMNVASTACGVEDLAPIRFSTKEESLYHYLVNELKLLEVKVDLHDKFTGKGKIPDTDIESTGSTKNDAYLWAKAQYMDTGKTSSTLMAYYVDGYSDSKNEIRYNDLHDKMLPNRDYLIAQKAFFFDLNPYSSTIPDDDKAQKEGTDYTTLTTLLKKQNELAGDKTILIRGFVPWMYKYTNYTDPTLTEPVATEWQSVKVFSTYNAMIDADINPQGNLANASVYMHYPMKDQYKQVSKKPDPSKVKLENKNYLLVYMGDYDSAGWLNSAMPYVWRDYHRGDLPLCWPINAELANRAPHVIDYMYATQTENDYFVTGDNGIGYLNPNALVNPNRDKTLNGSLTTWVNECIEKLNRFDLSISGFLINSPLTFDEKVKEAYAKLTPNGVVTDQEPSYSVSYGTPFVGHMDVTADVQTSVNMLASAFTVPDEPNFKMIRIILKSPTHVYEINKQLQLQYPEMKFEIVDPYTFFELIRQASK